LAPPCASSNPVSRISQALHAGYAYWRDMRRFMLDPEAALKRLLD